MTKLSWNESQKYLMTNWPDARAMEREMEGIRKHYDLFLKRVADRISKQITVFDRSYAYSKASGWTGGICLSRSTWPTNGEGHSGFWLEHLRLEYLCNDEEDGTDAYLWISDRTFDHSACRLAIQQSSSFKKHKDEESLRARLGEGEFLLEVEAPPKQDLRSQLIDNNEAGFTDLCATVFVAFAEYIPIVDEWLAKVTKGSQ